MICATVLLLSAVLMPQDTHAASVKKAARKAYSRLLQQSEVGWEGTYGWDYAPSGQLSFALYDIDKNGVEELILYWAGAPHSMGWNRIYTYYGGKIRSLGVYSEVTLYKNRKYICNAYAGQGEISIGYYSIRKGKAKEVVSYDLLDHRSGGKLTKKTLDGMTFYCCNERVNGKGTTYKKCMQKEKTIIKSARVKKLQYKRNTEKNRNRYLT